MRPSFAFWAALLGVVPSAAAQPAKVGPEIVVTLAEGAYVVEPRVAADPAGNFLVAWADDYDDPPRVRAQAFYSTGNPRGPIFTVTGADHGLYSGTLFRAEPLSVAADGGGNFVVAYTAWDFAAAPGGACAYSTGPGCAWTRRLDVNGSLSPSIFIVGDPRQNVYPPFDYNTADRPEIESDAEGGFVVVWEGYDGSDEGVFARKLVGSGQVSGGPFRVNDDVYGYQGDYGRFDVATDGASNFNVVWVQEGGSPNPGVLIKRFDAEKHTIVPATIVSPTVDDHPKVASLPSGETMVVWSSGSDEISGRVYDENGVAVGPEFIVAAGVGSYGGDISAGSTSFVVVWDGAGGPEGQMFDAAGAPVGSVFTTTTGTGYLPEVAGDADDNFVVVWREPSGKEWRAQRFESAPPTPSEIPLLGKSMVLINKTPDDFEKSKGRWKAGGEDIVVPLRGSASDPRCNGDPVGTAKASVRFVSATSGQDTGPIPLPCQNWDVTGGGKVGSVPKRGYKYRDGQRLDGPCNSVKIKGTKSLSVSCKGKPGLATFTYDLVSGVSQGSVAAVLEMGLFKYCAEFEPFFDGSDGKKYKGKSFATPVGCP